MFKFGIFIIGHRRMNPNNEFDDAKLRAILQKSEK